MKAALSESQKEFRRTCRIIALVLGTLFFIDILVHSREIEAEIMVHFRYSKYMEGKNPITNLTLSHSNCTDNSTFLTNWKCLALCVQRNKDFYYTEASECSPGYKMCNPGLCIVDSEPCPVTNASLKTNETTKSLEFVTQRLAYSPLWL